MFESKEIQRPHGLQKVQNGGAGHSKRVAPPPRLDGEGRHAKGIPSHSCTQRIPKVFTVSVEREKMAICMPSVWATKRSQNLHKSNETCPGSPTGKGTSISMLFGRHSDPIPIKEKGPKRHRPCNKNTTRSGVLNKFQKIHNQANTQDRVLSFE